MKATVNGREYTVEARDMMATPRLHAELLNNGWDGTVYYLTGKRGAVKMAYRRAESGQFAILN